MKLMRPCREQLHGQVMTFTCRVVFLILVVHCPVLLSPVRYPKLGAKRDNLLLFSWCKVTLRTVRYPELRCYKGHSAVVRVAQCSSRMVSAQHNTCSHPRGNALGGIVRDVGQCHVQHVVVV